MTHVMEHRWGQRSAVHAGVLLHPPHSIGRGVVCNVSISGAFVHTSLRPRLFSHIELEMELDPAHRRISAWVVRRDRAGIAVEWDELAPEAVTVVRSCSAHMGHSPGAGANGERLSRV